jgi:hypothetical protein
MRNRREPISIMIDRAPSTFLVASSFIEPHGFAVSRHGAPEC